MAYETLSKRDLAQRWKTSIRTVDRLRQAGKLPWIDMAAGRGGRPLVRFALSDVEQFEQRFRQCPEELAAEGGRR